MTELSKTELQTAIDEWTIGRNGERDRAILRRRLIDGIPFEKLAEEFDLSVRHTKEIVYKRVEYIFKHIPG